MEKEGPDHYADYDYDYDYDHYTYTYPDHDR